ncbi:MAG: nitroreductase [Myxococcota bacterium]|jgi:nitroreductase
MNVEDALKTRRSIKWFDPTFTLSDEDLAALIGPALYAPTSFNLQHWRFIAVRCQATQDALCEASWGQRQVADCSVDIVIVAKKPAHEDASLVWTGAPKPVADNMVNLIEGFYGDDETRQRDEAIRSGGLAAMALMLRATEMGLDTCPMIGFDPAKFRTILQVPDEFIIVLLLCVGKGTTPAYPRVGRFDLSEVVRLDGHDGPPLKQSDS